MDSLLRGVTFCPFVPGSLKLQNGGQVYHLRSDSFLVFGLEHLKSSYLSVDVFVKHHVFVESIIQVGNKFLFVSFNTGGITLINEIVVYSLSNGI